jgi:hypothetical protein
MKKGAARTGTAPDYWLNDSLVKGLAFVVHTGKHQIYLF